jgi:L,D-peptidoglycan transpeptidase YkuD (ErfK/YbiS/YcfS/YnhG family)
MERDLRPLGAARFFSGVRRFFLLFCLCGLFVLPARALDTEVRQLLVSIAPDWNSSTGTLIGLQRTADGDWKPTFGPIPVLFGKNGLAWGRGIHGTEGKGRAKVERDLRAPAGVFALGTIYTYDQALPKGATTPFHTVTAADAWVDDPSLPEYNRHIAVDLKNPPPWFEKQRMRHNDFAYRWLVEIRHNADPPKPGFGSAIFFHVRRGETRPTAGCTTMAQADLLALIRWLRPEAHPHYALLPRAEYARLWKPWDLPSPALLPCF